MSTDAPDGDAQAGVRLIELGRIASAYGIKGWVKIQPHSAQSEVLLSVRQWWLSKAATGASASASGFVTSAGVAPQAEAIDVLAARPQGSALVAQLRGVADRNQAEALRGRTVFVPRDAFPKPEDGEYYWVDLLGCLVYGDQDGQSALLGRVSDVTDNGVHAILKVERLVSGTDAAAELAPVLDAKGRSVESLVPFVDAHLLSVDIAARRIDTNWPIDF